MPLTLVLPPVEVPHSLGRVLPQEPPDGQFQVIEAWPGSVVFEDWEHAAEDQFTGSTYGFILDCSGNLPEDVIGILIVVPAEEVEKMRRQHEPLMVKLRERAGWSESPAAPGAGRPVGAQ